MAGRYDPQEVAKMSRATIADIILNSHPFEIQAFELREEAMRSEFAEYLRTLKSFGSSLNEELDQKIQSLKAKTRP